MQPDPGPAPNPAAPSSPAFRLAVVPGVNPAKWLRVWDQRLPDHPLVLTHVTAAQAPAALRDAGADAALLRLPVDRTVLSAIPLYTETTVVVVPTDHLLAAADEVTAADLADDVLLVPDDDVLAWSDPPGRPWVAAAPATTSAAVELVAAGAGVLVVPQSLARLHHRRDLTYRTVTDAPTSSVALAWPTDRAGDLVEELVGIVRGRTVNSSRGRGTGGPAGEPATAAASRGGTAGGGPSGSARGGTTRGAPRRPTAGRRGGGGGRPGAGGGRPRRSGGR